MEFNDASEEGVMKFCVQNPTDARCIGPGQRRGLSAAGFNGPSFDGQNLGVGNLEMAQGDEVDINPELGGAGAARNADKGVTPIASMDKEAAKAKDLFNAPAAARGGGGGGGAGAGGAGGASASASANPLSRDPGVESEQKKEKPLEITKSKASYVGATYSGGSYTGGSKKVDEQATANPFASMFGKKDGRDPASVPEIDKPASDLFAKISHRYGEVQKRKGLLELAVDEKPGLR
jgi:hypothetical protein